MNRQEIKQLLDEKYSEYCKSDFFIETDPIQIPKTEKTSKYPDF